MCVCEVCCLWYCSFFSRPTCVYVVGYFLRASSVSKLAGSLLTMSVATSSRISSLDLPPPDVVRACVCLMCVCLCVWWLKARDCQLNNHRFKSHELTGESFFPNLAFYPGPSKKLNQVPGLGWRSRRPQGIPNILRYWWDFGCPHHSWRGIVSALAGAWPSFRSLSIGWLSIPCS